MCVNLCAVRYPNVRTAQSSGSVASQEVMHYKGMAGQEVLEWSDIMSEIKTAGLTDDPLAPPDL